MKKSIPILLALFTGCNSTVPVSVSTVATPGTATLPTAATTSPSITGCDTTGAFGGGDGSSGNPYKICTVAHLSNIQNYNALNFIQVSDIDLAGTSLITVSTFSGVYDGGGFKMKNPNIELFAGSSGTVKNVNVVSGSTTVGQSLLVGQNQNTGIVTHCTVNGTINAGSEVGLLVGYNYGTISNSSSSGSVTGNTWAGGLVGYSQGTITSSYSTATVVGGNATGGLVGEINFGTITNSYATGDASGIGDIGGLVGSNHGGTINKCYSITRVSGGGSSTLGGLVGYAQGGFVTASYWDTVRSAQFTSAQGTGYTSGQMQNPVNFPGWASPWILSLGSYPALQ